MSIEPPELELAKERPPQPPKRWDYETFKEYLLAQARGKEFLLPLNEFPEEIELSSKWHDVLNTMRNKTNKDSVERVGLVGYNLDQRAIYLPDKKIVEIPWTWERNAPVSTDAINIQRAQVMIQGAEGLTGVLHSHPPHDINVLGFRIKTGRLSAGDLYDILAVDTYGPMIGVATGAINSLAFRTRESIIPRDDHKTFYDLWEGDPQLENLDEVIAQKYNIALYKGEKDGTLKRTYPKKR